MSGGAKGRRSTNPQPALGTAVRQLRQQAELSQAALASRAGLDPSWIGRIEAGRSNPSWGNVRRIAAGLGIPLEQLAELAEALEGERAER